MIPTAGVKTILKNGFHKKIPVRSYVIILTEIGGSRVKAVRLDEQISLSEAQKTALADNVGWRWKGAFPLTDRDFEKGEENEKGND